MIDRHLKFSGSFNTRDLGGIPTKKGSITRFNSLVRSDNVEFFSPNDWDCLVSYGVRTIIDLRFPDEIKGDENPRPCEIKTINISLDSGDDQDFWDRCKKEGLWCTPLYYKDHLLKFADISSRVLKVIANSNDVVLFHCMSGRDRTGLISMILLHLAGVKPDVIAQDHEISHDKLSAKCNLKSEHDEYPFIRELMTKYNKTTNSVISEILTSINIEKMLLSNRISLEELQALRQKL